MKTSKEKVYDFLKLHSSTGGEGVATDQLAQALGIQRTNVSSILNGLVQDGKAEKMGGRPVLYRIRAQDAENDDAFSNLVGHDGSLKRAVQLAKAAVLYPGKSLNAFLYGQRGTGKSMLALLMHRFALESGALPANAPYVVFNCRDYTEDETLAQHELFGGETEGCFQRAARGVLFIDHADLMNARLRGMLCSYLENGDSDSASAEPFVIIACDEAARDACRDLEGKLPISIPLPLLSQRPLSERMTLIQRFLTLEAARANKVISISAELLRCLLLWDCSANVFELKSVIKLGCANAYVRERNAQSDTLTLYISDFGHAVRKGFLNYRKHRDEVENIIPSDYSYSFNETSMAMSAIDRDKLKYTSAYDDIDCKAKEFAARGFSDSEIGVLLSAELDTVFRRYREELNRRIVNREQLAKLVDTRVIELVGDLLEEAAARFSVQYPPSVYYGLCLHVHSAIQGHTKSYSLATGQIAEIVENNRAEHALSLLFASRVEKTFRVMLLAEDVALVTMFLCTRTIAEDTFKRPVILYVFHGTGVAAALAQTVNSLVKSENTFFYDIPFEQENDVTYAALREEIGRIDRGKGVIALYDMDFLREILNTVSFETGIEVRPVAFPITALGVEWSRRAVINEDAHSLHKSMLEEMANMWSPPGNAIITLCATGEGGAEQLKRYIEQNADIPNTRVIPLSVSDADLLREKLLVIMQNDFIECIVGAYDPELFGIPFIPVSEVLSAPPQKVTSVLRLKGREKGRIDFEEIYRYLAEQLEHVDMKKLRRQLPMVLEGINSIMELPLDTELGLMIHIACAINRLIAREPMPQNLYREQIIRQNSRDYRELMRLLHPLEKSFHVVFSDNELANIITIIRKL